MDNKQIKIAIKNKDITVDKINDIILLNDESIITIWTCISKNNNLFFASLSNPNHKDSYILELKKYKNLPEPEYNKKYAELLKKYELDELIDFTTGFPDLSRTA